MPPQKVGYRYDYSGRRYARDVYAWDEPAGAYAAEPSRTTLYYYDGWNLVYEATFGGITYSGGVPVAATFERERAYFWGLDWSTTLDGAGGVGGLVALAVREAGEATPTLRYPGYDGNGNLVNLLDAAGNVTASYEYGPYGELWRASGPDADKNPFRFSTKYYDDETGHYYYGHRYYSPEYGRFLSQDPIGEAGGLHLHTFVNNNPVNAWDYLGLSIGLFSNFGGYAFDRWNPVTFDTPGASFSSINVSFSGPSIDQQLDALGGYGGMPLQNTGTASFDMSGLANISGLGTLPEGNIEDPAWVRGAFWYMEATSAGADELKNNVVSMYELAMLLSPTNRDYEAKSQAFNSFVESARSTGEDPRGSYDALTDAIADYVMRMLDGDPDAFGRFAASIMPAPKIRLLKMLDDVPRMRGPNRTGNVLPSSPHVTRVDPRFPGRPDPQWSIDTRTFSNGVETANGGLRNNMDFWQQWAAKNPDSLSQSNLYRINELGLSPKIDDTWIRYFPEHRNHLKEIIIHHHVDQGPYAIPIPSSTHIGPGGVWHTP